MENKKVKYKDLKESDIEYLTKLCFRQCSHEEKVREGATKYNVSERTIRLWWDNLGLKNKSKELPRQLIEASKRTLNKDTEIILVTSVQNKTHLNLNFWENLKIYKEYLETTLGKKTEIVVIPTRYRNPTSNIESEKTKELDFWSEEIENNLFYGQVKFGNTLISASSRISPTAKDPLNGYEILANGNHLILGHSKIHFKTLPRLRGENLLTMCSTGYLSIKNYSDSKAGQVAFENHSYGFVIVEKGLVPRNVKVKSDGSFIDLKFEVDKDVKIITESEGLVWGDMHIRQLNEDVYNKTKKLISHLKPKINVLHDVFDGSTVNPHETKDMFTQRLKIAEGKHLIEEEVEECLNVIEDLKGCCGEVVVVESNHDNFLQRFIDSENWKRDLHNSPAYLKYAYIQQTVDLRKYGNIFGYLVHERFNGDVKYIEMGSSMQLADYEVGAHGDFGSNGSRGSAQGFNRLNRKMIHGHQHSPVLLNNVTTVGVTCNLNQYYNRKGLSSWAYAHSIVHSNGKNQLLVFNDDLIITKLF